MALRRMTLGFYGYIGQNYIFAYFNSKTSEIYKKKKSIFYPIFYVPAVALIGGNFDKFL